MNEKAPEVAERSSKRKFLRMGRSSKKVARRPGAERMCPSEYMGPGDRCSLEWYAGTDRRGATRVA